MEIQEKNKKLLLGWGRVVFQKKKHHNTWCQQKLKLEDEWNQNVRLWSAIVKKKTQSNPAEFVTLDELLDLLKESRGRCCITGLVVPFHEGTHIRYWSLSVDHKEPLTKAKNQEGVQAKRNLQIMCRGVNEVKGSYSDEGTKIWYRNYVKHNPLTCHKKYQIAYYHPLSFFFSTFLLLRKFRAWLPPLYTKRHTIIDIIISMLLFFYWTNKIIMRCSFYCFF